MTTDEVRQLLSERQLEIVSALVASYTNKEIAENLGLTLTTVEFQLYRIMEKLGVSTRAQLALMWL